LLLAASFAALVAGFGLRRQVAYKNVRK